jgi:hypothetical protein
LTLNFKQSSLLAYSQLIISKNATCHGESKTHAKLAKKTRFMGIYILPPKRNILAIVGILFQQVQQLIC